MFIQDLKNLWTFIRNINAARNQVFLSSRKETRKEKIVAPRFGGFTFNEKEVKKVNGLGNSSPTPPSSLSHSVSFATRSYPSQPPKGTAVSPTTKAEGRLKQPLQSILFVYTGHFYLPPAKTERQKKYFAAAERGLKRHSSAKCLSACYCRNFSNFSYYYYGCCLSVSLKNYYNFYYETNTTTTNNNPLSLEKALSSTFKSSIDRQTEIVVTATLHCSMNA